MSTAFGPVHTDTSKKWWFWNELWTARLGPFDDKETAFKALVRYAAMELEGEPDPYPEIATLVQSLQWSDRPVVQPNTGQGPTSRRQALRLGRRLAREVMATGQANCTTPLHERWAMVVGREMERSVARIAARLGRRVVITTHGLFEDAGNWN